MTTPLRKPTPDDVARTRKLWAANKPGETAAPAYAPEPPALWLVALAVTLAVILQSAVLSAFALRGAMPSLVLLVVAWYGLRTGTARGIACGLLAGACEDALAGSSGFAWTFATGFAGALAGRAARPRLSDMKLLVLPLVFALTGVRYFVFAALMQAQSRPLTLGSQAVHAVLWQSIFNAALAFVVLRIAPPVTGTGAYRR